MTSTVNIDQLPKNMQPKLPGRNGAFVYKRADIERFADARAAARQENAS